MAKGALVVDFARFPMYAVSCHLLANLGVWSWTAQSQSATVLGAQEKEGVQLNLRTQSRLRKKTRNQLPLSCASYAADQLVSSYVMISRGKGAYPAPRCRICSRSSRAVNGYQNICIMSRDCCVHTGSHGGGTASR